MRKIISTKIIVLSCICCLIVFNACDPGTGPDTLTSFTNEDEKNLGSVIHKAMISSDNFNIMPEDNYIKSVRIQLVATNLMEKIADFDWNIYVIANDNILDCFTTVGGNIYIYSGLMKNIQNEAQFMSILAHEMFYADRSYHMDILNASYSFPFLLDVSRGGDEATPMEMLNLFYNIPRNPNLVLEADAYGESIICETARPTSDFKTIIEGMGQANNLWYQNHKQPSNVSLNSRTSNLTLGMMGVCGADNEDNLGPYSNFVQTLP